MARTLTLNVRISGTLGDHVAACVGEDGPYENVSEYVRDLIRRDKMRAEAEAFERLKAELTHAFALPDEGHQPLDARTVIERNKRG